MKPSFRDSISLTSKLLLCHLLCLFLIFFPTSTGVFPNKIRSEIDRDFGRRQGQFPEFVSRGNHPGGHCDQTITTETAWIYSPNYPLDYDPNTICVYNVFRSHDDVCQLEFTFEDFDLEDSRPSCLEDYLELGPGNRLCGSLIPDFRRKYSSFLSSKVRRKEIKFHFIIATLKEVTTINIKMKGNAFQKKMN